MTQILVIEDEERIASFVSKGLASAGYGCTVAARASTGFDYAMTGDFALAILDIGLPDEDGFALLRRLRANGAEMPIIVLTARSSAEDTLAGLEGGADDYMGKPFSLQELIARIRLRLRDRVGTDAAVLTNGTLSLDLRSRVMTSGSKAVDLSAREFALAEEFMRHPGQVLTRDVLLSRVWGYDFDPGSNVVDVYVRYLRGKLGAEHIETVRGAGYRLVTPRGDTVGVADAG